MEDTLPTKKGFDPLQRVPKYWTLRLINKKIVMWVAIQRMKGLDWDLVRPIAQKHACPVDPVFKFIN